MRSTLLFAILSSGVLLGGCGTFVDFTPINDPPHPLSARSVASVEVLSSGPPNRPHVDVAIVEVEQTHSLNAQGTGLMIQRMREQAAAIGCDAIVLGGVTDHQGAESGSGWDLLDPGSTKRQATCVVYDEEPRVGTFKVAQPPAPVTPPRAGSVTQRVDGEWPSAR
jgi:hypothetical protein